MSEEDLRRFFLGIWRAVVGGNGPGNAYDAPGTRQQGPGAVKWASRWSGASQRSLRQETAGQEVTGRRHGGMVESARWVCRKLRPAPCLTGPVPSVRQAHHAAAVRRGPESNRFSGPCQGSPRKPFLPHVVPSDSFLEIRVGNTPTRISTCLPTPLYKNYMPLRRMACLHTSASVLVEILSGLSWQSRHEGVQCLCAFRRFLLSRRLKEVRGVEL